jgi:hypothetical protein
VAHVSPHGEHTRWRSSSEGGTRSRDRGSKEADGAITAHFGLLLLLHLTGKVLHVVLSLLVCAWIVQGASIGRFSNGCPKEPVQGICRGCLNSPPCPIAVPLGGCVQAVPRLRQRYLLQSLQVVHISSLAETMLLKGGTRWVISGAHWDTCGSTGL